MCYSIDKVPKVTSPVLVIHGTEDEVIDFSHGLAIYERCPRAVEPLWVDVCIKVTMNSPPSMLYILKCCNVIQSHATGAVELCEHIA